MKLRLLILSLLCCPGLRAVEVRQPNILLVLIDDMGVMDTSLPFMVDEDGKPKKHALNQLYRTPSMERLAANGFRCSRFYANSVCSPTRTTLMTGQSSARHHTTQWIQPNGRNAGPNDPPDWNWEGLTRKHLTLPRLLKSAGYRTIHCGKGHFGNASAEGADPCAIGFDVNIAGGAIGHPSSYLGKDGFGHTGGTSKSHAVPGLEEYRGKDIFLTEALTLELKKEITKSVEEQKPFFAYMAHYGVHTPFMADERFTKDYDAKRWSKQQIAFASLIAGIDKSLGDLLDHLDALKVSENTLVIFLGDNGSDAPMGHEHGHASSAPLRGKKGTHYEGGMRVPFIAAWAKPSDQIIVQRSFPIVRGSIDSTQIGSIQDIMPTLLKAAFVEPPANYTMDGSSLWPWLSGKRGSQPQQFLMHFPHSHRSSYFTVYIESNWKLVLHHQKQAAERYELFNLADDPSEKTNLAPSDPAALARMKGRMLEELKDANAQPSKPFATLEEMVGE